MFAIPSESLGSCYTEESNATVLVEWESPPRAPDVTLVPAHPLADAANASFAEVSFLAPQDRPVRILTAHVNVVRIMLEIV